MSLLFGLALFAECSGINEADINGRGNAVPFVLNVGPEALLFIPNNVDPVLT